MILQLSSFCVCDSLAKPNIIIIMADDLGWNDVSFHGKLSLLFFESKLKACFLQCYRQWWDINAEYRRARLQRSNLKQVWIRKLFSWNTCSQIDCRFYTPPLCTPSRSSFMTGKNPIKTGLSQFPFLVLFHSSGNLTIFRHAPFCHTKRWAVGFAFERENNCRIFQRRWLRNCFDWEMAFGIFQGK